MPDLCISLAEEETFLRFASDPSQLQNQSSFYWQSELSGFKSFSSYYNKPYRKIVVYSGAAILKLDDVEILPLPVCIEKLFG